MFNKYKFRCHYQGSLISVPNPLTANQLEMLFDYRKRGLGEGKQLTPKQEQVWHSLEHKEEETKNYSLTNTAKGLCAEIVFAERYGRRKSLNLKQFEKGLATEKAGRDLLSSYINELLISDEEIRSNEWVVGKRDIKHDELIIDIKSSFDFQSFSKKRLETNYEYNFRQVDSYMDIWKIKQSMLAYVLIDTPERIIEDELRRSDWKNDIFDMNGTARDSKIQIIKDIVNEHLFTKKGLDEFCQQSSSVQVEWFDDFVEIPQNERIHIVEHKFDKARIEQRNNCLTLCRNLMNEINNKYQKK